MDDWKSIIARLLNSGATPETLRMMNSPMSASEIFHSVANPDAVLNSPVAQTGSGFAPIGLAGIMTYHGTPHSVSTYDLSKVGTGQGAQSYGHGIYFAENPATAQSYRDMLSHPELSGPEGPYLPLPGTPEKDAMSWLTLAQSYLPQRGVKDPNSIMNEAINLAKDYPESQQALLDMQKRGVTMKIPGTVYKQDLPDEVLPKMLQWDKPLSQQSDSVQKAIADYVPKTNLTGQPWPTAAQDMTGGDLIQSSSHDIADILNKRGVPGVSYLDFGSRSAGKGTMNHVIWDQDLLNRMVPQPVE